jgi:catechol 2,3-dioxygenase-like lactoylglutathione lyase family enzyme
MNWTLEVVVVPVTDVDRAKDFYENKVGFAVDHDTRVSDELRIVQLTPPGSGCSIQVAAGYFEDMVPGSLRGLVLVVPDVRAAKMAPGSLEGLQLVVNDVHQARKELVERGVEGVSEVQVYGAEGPRPEQPGDDLNNVGFVYFADPDGNKWGVQQITARS